MPEKYNPLFDAVTQQYGLPEGILRDIQQLETGNLPEPESALGPRTRQGRAQGMMQIMPATSRAYGGNPMVPEEAVDMAGRITRDNLRSLRRAFPNISEEELRRLAVGTYHSGIGNVRRAGGIPDKPAARTYMERYDALRPKPEMRSDVNPYYAEEMAAGAVMPNADKPASPRPAAAAAQPSMDPRSLKFLMDIFQSAPQAPETYASDTYIAALRRG